MKLQAQTLFLSLAIVLVTLVIWELVLLPKIFGGTVVALLLMLILLFGAEIIAKNLQNESERTKVLPAGTAPGIGLVDAEKTIEIPVQLLADLKTELASTCERLTDITAVKERMESELNTGREIQMNLLTLTLPDFPQRQDLNVYAVLKPAKELGGDFYDFGFLHGSMSYLFEDNRFFFCVGDVSGKGVPAALFLSVVKSLINAQSSQDSSPANILTRVNQAVSLHNPSCMFVTLFCGVLNLIDGELTYTNAGHNPPFIKRQTGALEKLTDKHGPALGIVENLEYRKSQTVFHTGDTLFIYTDGVTEAMDRDQQLFSEPRLVSLLENTLSFQPRTIIDRVVREVECFQGDIEQFDDITLLALQFLGREALDDDELLSLSLKRNIVSRPNST